MSNSTITPVVDSPLEVVPAARAVPRPPGTPAHRPALLAEDVLRDSPDPADAKTEPVTVTTNTSAAPQ